VEKVRKLLDDIEQPFSLVILHLDDFAGVGRLRWMRSEISDDSNSVHVFTELRRKMRQHLLDLLGKVLLLRDAARVHKDELETTTGECGRRLSAHGQDGDSLSEVCGEPGGVLCHFCRERS